MAEKDIVFTYASAYGSYEVKPKVNIYRDWDNLYVGLECFDPEFGVWDRFCDVTVNLVPLRYLEAAIDTNNNGGEVLNFLEDNGFAVPTGQFLRSGFCSFPVYRFNEAVLEKIDPINMAEYRRSRGMEKVALDQQILGAAESRPAQKRLHATLSWHDCIGQTVLANPPRNIPGDNIDVEMKEHSSSIFEVSVYFDDSKEKLAYRTGQRLEILSFNRDSGMVGLHNKENGAIFYIPHTDYIRDIGTDWTPDRIYAPPEMDR